MDSFVLFFYIHFQGGFSLPSKTKQKKNLSAMKRARQSVKQNLRNRSRMSSVKTVLKKLDSSITSGNKEDAGKILVQAIKALNQAASKGVIHKNTAARNVSRITKKVNAFLKAGAA
jgi:small subunit ribosomal protein S20